MYILAYGTQDTARFQFITLRILFSALSDESSGMTNADVHNAMSTAYKVHLSLDL